MNQQIFDVQDLPLDDLGKIGLIQDGGLVLDREDVDTLLSGRRTAMLRFENLSFDGFNIPVLDAKLSLKPAANGELELMLHPMYKKAIYPAWLTDTEAEKLEKGEAVNLEKMIFDDEGQLKDVLVEFDKETNEFIITDTEKVQAPDKVNNEALTKEQKDRFRKGKEVELEDGTKFQFSAAEPKGLRSNRLQLIVSLVVDGGISFVLFKALNAMLGHKQEKSAEVNNSKGFQAAKRAMDKQEEKRGLGIDNPPKEEYSRGYNRSGSSR
ncbi:DUF3945 domain-containing protein [Mucilaginibacter sp. Mucisp84]|uniref:DUF3945 domain-containing protein n=1 Tax=Mucilaginibacter sp. Mucisp84 TaxID=3243058 RepID=UPI0039A69ACC